MVRFVCELRGISGDTSDGTLARFETELKPRLSLTESNIVVIATGINDSAIIPAEKYQTNLIQLVNIARKYTQEIIFIGPTPIDEAKVEVPWVPGKFLTSQSVQQFNQIMSKVAKTNNLKYVNLFNDLPPEYIKTLDDGVHPNRDGHLMIFNLVRSVLK
ncbi:MAG: GDSL-type esterase/lipase family protein [Patescibacteria group bacterium]